jgi:competence protein ComEA
MRVDINKATLEQLLAITQIGQVRAEAIIDYRATNEFRDIYELSAIRGIGQKRLDAIVSEGVAYC